MEGRWTFLVVWAVGWSCVAIDRDVHGGVDELRRTWRADAVLHDVQMVSARQCWAVGDHGTLWQTSDGGKTWTLIDTGASASFRSVCVLTDQFAWVAGWRIQGSSELTEGVLLATRDGGQSWQSLDTKSLSPLRYVRFFGLEEGIVGGEPTPENPTGVWRTADGGQSWQSVAGPPARGWLSIGLQSPELGLLADRDGNIALLAGTRLLPSRLTALKGRSIRGVALSSADQGWLVGDGGLVLNSKSGGVVWEPPEGSLPEGVRQVSDFRTVSVKDEAVWIAGDPGGMIWHSPNAGRQWVKQATGSTTPINKIHFLTKTQGCAVGEMGLILTTQDGGEHWSVAQGRGRHAALLSIHHRDSTLSPELLTKLSGEQGYRTATWVGIRPQDVSGPLSRSDRISEAVTHSGGSAATTAWQLPLDSAGLELNSDKLLENWQRRTEGQLQQLLLGRIVREIRVWRPHVLIVDQPAPEDAAGQLIFDAALHAIEQAGDATRFVVQRELGGLGPWKVERVYMQLLPGSTGEIMLDPFEFLPRWQTNARMASTSARALLDLASSLARPNFRPLNAEGAASLKNRGSDFFSGLSLPPGGDVRRELFPIDDRQLDQQIKAVQRHRNYVAHAERSFDDPQLAGQMLAQLKDVTTGMTVEQAALTLFDIFQEYRQRGQVDLAEATGQELLRRFSDQPVTAEVARWMLTSLVSEEATWQKVRQLKAERRSKPGTLSAPVRQISHQAQMTHLPELKERFKKGQQAFQFLETSWPRLSTSAEIQFPLAALNRARGTHNQADAIYRRWINHTEDQTGRDWADIVRREIWLAQQGVEVPEGVASCYRTPTRPQLDGLLSDDCWQEAREWMLAHRVLATMPDVPAPLVMLAYDDEFLYIAASVPRIDGQSTDPPKSAGRSHDADLRRHDRLTVLLDIDRDYHTWYAFHVDQRGCTADVCWNDTAWNPQWFVAAAGDTSHWRVELAIPWGELTSKRPAAGAAWGLSLERTAPAVGSQSWIRSTASQLKGTTLGLLRFE